MGTGGHNGQVTITYTSQAPAITSANNATFTVGTAGSFPITVTGTPTPTLTVPANALPIGITLGTDSTGKPALIGTPAAGSARTYTFNLTVTNSVGSTAQSFTLTVNQKPAITSAASTTFTV
ncbi:putative Ig domain-containing protein, partial [Kitasatospora sp. MBT63]|uniref:putative Ig domain-containing protein n=1 Tax=Kitasatospora sp. MBT63 TaxID=1444768 RepID=UPI000539ECFD